MDLILAYLLITTALILCGVDPTSRLGRLVLLTFLPGALALYGVAYVFASVGEGVERLIEYGDMRVQRYRRQRRDARAQRPTTF